MSKATATIPADWNTDQIGTITLPSGNELAYGWCFNEFWFFSAKGTGYRAVPTMRRDAPGMYYLLSWGGTILRHRSAIVYVFIVGDLAEVVS